MRDWLVVGLFNNPNLHVVDIDSRSFVRTIEGLDAYPCRISVIRGVLYVGGETGLTIFEVPQQDIQAPIASKALVSTSQVKKGFCVSLGKVLVNTCTKEGKRSLIFLS